MARWTLAGLLILAATSVGEPAEREPRPDDPVFAAIYEQGPAFLKGKDVTEQPHFAEHVTHLRSRSEWLIGGGPFALRSADPAVGLVVFQAADVADAQRWISLDPAVVAEVFNVTVRQWGVTNVRALRLTESR